MGKSGTWRIFIVLIAILLSTAGGAAARSGFGLAGQKLHVPFSKFQPRYPSLFTYAMQCCAGGYVHPVSGVGPSASMIAPLDESMIPKGARITSIFAYFYDGTAGLDEDLSFSLCRTWVDLVNPAGGDCLVTFTSEGAPGDGFAFSGAVNHTVDYTDQVDGDVQTEEVSYQLLVDFGVNTKVRQYFGDELRFGQIVINYVLQVSPPPETANFLDVPEDAPEFAAVEAMWRAGIAQGCDAGFGPDRFCPDAPVTRAQLAVLMARALGLHWGSQ